MKIFQIHNEYIYRGGEDLVVEQEKNLLLKNNCKVHQLIKKNKEEIISLTQKLNVTKNLSYSKKSYQIIEKEINRIKPDIVHIHNTFPLWTSSVIDACNNQKIPTVMTIHNFRLICAKAVFYRNGDICEKCLWSTPFNAVKYGCFQDSKIKSIPVAYMIHKSKKGLKIIDKLNKIIVLTDFSKKKLIQAKFPESKIIIKPNFLSEKINIKIREKKDDFIYASRLSEEKGFLDLLSVHKKFNFNLKICGDGPLIELLNNQRNINYLGFLSNEDVNSELAKTKFLIFPSKWYEGFPTIILKAFQFETVVLAPALGSISAIIKDGYNGILFKPNNIEDLINKIKWALSNEEKCNQIKDNAKKEFNEKYTEEVNYNILKKIYEDAIEENKNNKLLN